MSYLLYAEAKTAAQQVSCMHSCNIADLLKQLIQQPTKVLTDGMDESMLSVGESGVLAKIFSRSFVLKPRGRLPMRASAMKLLCKLAEPRDVHLNRSSCKQAKLSVWAVKPRIGHTKVMLLVFVDALSQLLGAAMQQR